MNKMGKRIKSAMGYLKMLLISKFLIDSENVANEIIKIEKENDISLPSEYKKFICKYNGGHTPDTQFKVGRISSDICAFYGVGEVEYSLSKIDLSEWIEKNVIPIAYDIYGNHIVIGLRAGKAGKIYFYDHEEGHKLKELTDDLISFFKCCRSKKIGYIPSIEEREQLLIKNGKEANITDSLRKAWRSEIDLYKDMVQEEVIIE